VAEAGRDGLAGDDFEIHAPASAIAVANVAHVFEEPRPGSDRARFLRRAHSDLSSPVRVRGAEPRSAPAGAFQCHGASERGMDGATAARGVRAGREPSVSDPRSGSGLWRTIFTSGQDIEPPRGGRRTTLALAKCLCGARDWLDSPGMPCPCFGALRSASSGDPGE